MRFNKYVWGLYRNSEQGKKDIEFWSNFGDFSDQKYYFDITEKFHDELISNNLGQYLSNFKLNLYELYKDHFLQKEFSFDKAKEIYKNWISNGIIINGLQIDPPNDYILWTTQIYFFSKILYAVHPEYFFPYILDCEFFKFKQICNEFDIPIPEVPKKKDWEDRAMYYIDLCEALLEFRKITGFSPTELCAFLYNFAPNVIKELEDNELPEPSKVWFVGGSKEGFTYLDDAKSDNRDYWQGNVDAKRGDIVVMYCVTPRSYIHSIWRVVVDGFADPFFYYFSAVCLSNPQKLDVHITLNDLKSNPVWSLNPLVKKNLQGINGYPIKYHEYIELLSILQLKGQDINALPTIKPTSRLDSDDLHDEREVEIRLIEPLFELLKYKPTDWIRQMPVKMGRGERNYPDYCFGANPKRGEESATMIVESKFGLKTRKDLQDAYFQAKSYALRLQCHKFVLASKEGIWIFEPKHGVYKIDNHFSCNWVEIENPDILYQLKQKIGKN